MAGDVLGRSVSQMLEDISRQEVAIAGGSLAALSAAGAAALTTMVARASRSSWPDSGGAIGQCEALRARLAQLVASDVEVFATARALLQRAGRDRDHHGAAMAPALARIADPDELRRQVDAALDAAAEIPVQIAEAAAEVVAAACWAAHEGSADNRADAVVAALLADAAVGAAAHLVDINLGARPDDDHAQRAAAARHAAAEAIAGL